MTSASFSGTSLFAGMTSAAVRHRSAPPCYMEAPALIFLGLKQSLARRQAFWREAKLSVQQ